MRFEELIAFERKEAAKDAFRHATIQNILDLLEDYGEIPDILKQKLEQSTLEALRKYLKHAAKADSIESFMKIME